jgi:hypothetical protein
MMSEAVDLKTGQMLMRKTERVRALVQKLGFANSLLILQMREGDPFNIIVDSDNAPEFVGVFAEPIAQMIEAYYPADGDASED